MPFEIFFRLNKRPHLHKVISKKVASNLDFLPCHNPIIRASFDDLLLVSSEGRTRLIILYMQSIYQAVVGSS